MQASKLKCSLNQLVKAYCCARNKVQSISCHYLSVTLLLISNITRNSCACWIRILEGTVLGRSSQRQRGNQQETSIGSYLSEFILRASPCHRNAEIRTRLHLQIMSTMKLQTTTASAKKPLSYIVLQVGTNRELLIPVKRTTSPGRWDNGPPNMYTAVSRDECGCADVVAIKILHFTTRIANQSAAKIRCDTQMMIMMEVNCRRSWSNKLNSSVNQEGTQTTCSS